MSSDHPWLIGKGGRKVHSREGGGIVASLACGVAGCGEVHAINFRNLCDAGEMDRKFRQAGWRTDNPRCPKHIRNRTSTEQPRMSSQLSPTAIKAQVQMFGLLSEHFDVESGCYAEGWSDKRIAQETQMAASAVTAYREQGFGPLKESPEIRALAADVEAVEGLLRDMEAQVRTVRADVDGLKAKLAEVRRKYA